MKKITLEINLEPSAWEVIEERASRSYEDIRKDVEESGEEFTFEDAVKNEIRYIIDKDIEMYDVYDAVRQSAEVQAAIRAEIKKVNDRNLENKKKGI